MLIKNKICILIIFCLSSQNLLAGSLKTGNPERKRSNSEAFTETVYKKFEKLQEMIADEMFAEARAGLNALLDRRLNKFEEAHVNQYIGWIDSGEGKYIEAAKRFKIAIDSDALPNQAHFGMMIQMSKLYMGGEKYQQALNVLHDYYKGVDEIEDKIFAYEANIYAQMKKYKQAIPVLKKAISLSEKPQEKWNYLLYSLYKQESKFQEASEVMELLISINPTKKDYWKNLSADYFNLKKDKKSLAILVLAKESGLIDDEKETIRLFQMYSFLDIPYKAGTVLEKGLRDGVIKSTFKRWEDLGKTWYSAAEMDNALVAYGEASKLATDGKIDFYRALIYIDREEWNKAKTALNSALEKGGLKEKEKGRAWMFLGMAESETNNYSKAIAALKKATKFENSRKNAYQWIEHLQARVKQQRKLAEAERANERERAANTIDNQ